MCVAKGPYAKWTYWMARAGDACHSDVYSGCYAHRRHGNDTKPRYIRTATFVSDINNRYETFF